MLILYPFHGNIPSKFRFYLFLGRVAAHCVPLSNDRLDFGERRTDA